MTASALPSAVFLDRDGTLVEDPGFLRDPAAVRLLPGAADAVARLNARGVPVVVVTNQSGLARGKVRWEEYAAVEARVGELLAAAGARLTATYLCPHHPEVNGPCPCRKPGTRLFERAAEELGLGLGEAVYIGDRIGDVEPALALGGRGILVATGEGQRHQAEALARGIPVVADLGAAVARVLGAPR